MNLLASFPIFYRSVNGFSIYSSSLDKSEIVVLRDSAAYRGRDGIGLKVAECRA